MAKNVESLNRNIMTVIITKKFANKKKKKPKKRGDNKQSIQIQIRAKIPHFSKNFKKKRNQNVYLDSDQVQRPKRLEVCCYCHRHWAW